MINNKKVMKTQYFIAPATSYEAPFALNQQQNNYLLRRKSKYHESCLIYTYEYQAYLVIEIN